MKILKLNSILFLLFVIVNACTGVDENVNNANPTNEKSVSNSVKLSNKSSSDFEQVHIIRDSILTVESKNVNTELQNVRINNLLIKDNNGDIIHDITTKVVANSNVDLYADNISDDLNLSIYVYEGSELVYQTSAHSGIFSDQPTYFSENSSLSKKCSFMQNLNCVDKRITDMSTSQYIHCLFTAELCYASQWIICVKYNCFGIK